MTRKSKPLTDIGGKNFPLLFFDFFSEYGAPVRYHIKCKYSVVVSFLRKTKMGKLLENNMRLIITIFSENEC